jgi:ABC-type Mn2+/Zn2+ transport system ATPase subunit
MPMRLNIWEEIANMDHSKLTENYAKTIGLEELKKEIETMLSGGQCGRVIVSHQN